MKHFFFVICFAAAFSVPAHAEVAVVRIPFVGCPSDGQIGPEPAPKAPFKSIHLDTATAPRLAFYQSKNDDGVLAPRGWHCINLLGSNGTTIIVAPAAMVAKDFLSSRTILGPAIQLSISDGGTSGRFEVAAAIARYFPSQSAFLKGVIGEGIEPTSDFPSGPYRRDKLLARSALTVTYETPPRSQGLGTFSRLEADDTPITSVAMLTDVGQDVDGPNLHLLTVRLPPKDRDLTGTIIGQVFPHVRPDK